MVKKMESMLKRSFSIVVGRHRHCSLKEILSGCDKYSEGTKIGNGIGGRLRAGSGQSQRTAFIGK